MIKNTILLAALVALVASAEVPQIFLPPDADVVTIVGNGFKLQVNQLAQMKGEWSSVVEETAKVENPRRADEDGALLNEGLFENAAKAADAGQPDLGALDEDLRQWVETRARDLGARIRRYQDELMELKGAHRVVVQILLLNTLVDLENLAKENLKKFKWIEKKVKTLGSIKVDATNDVIDFIRSKISENIKIEQKTKGTNKLNDQWMTNTQSVKRVLNEQRFSGIVSEVIIDFLSGHFSMMQRKRVFDLNRADKHLDDGLYYKRAKGHVPAHFPFFSQDAIMNGA